MCDLVKILQYGKQICLDFLVIVDFAFEQSKTRPEAASVCAHACVCANKSYFCKVANMQFACHQHTRTHPHSHTHRQPFCRISIYIRHVAPHCMQKTSIKTWKTCVEKNYFLFFTSFSSRTPSLPSHSTANPGFLKNMPQFVT